MILQWASQVAPVKNLPLQILPMQETWVLSLGQKDPLDKAMATPSSILAWRIPWTEEPGELQSVGSKGLRHDTLTLPQLSSEKGT